MKKEKAEEFEDVVQRLGSWVQGEEAKGVWGVRFVRTRMICWMELPRRRISTS